MDTYSSVEDLLIKTRKPYTISKQRERWTEEEHNRFLEALKLYGRAWQRIEEHIGTKTAVQIRSHAQKFFTKLEKEALVKGVPVGQALDIDIPPPRPKRKPSNPYPRKTGLGTSGPLLGATEPSPEKADGDERTGYGNDTQNENDCSEVLNLFQGASCNSLSSANRNCRSPTLAPNNSRSFKEFVPIRKMVHDDGTNNTVNLEKSLENPFQSEKTNANFHPENCGELASNEKQTTQNYPKHAPVHVLKPFFSYTEAAAVSANTQHVPTYPSFDPFFHSNQDNYQAYLQASSVFSGLIVSSLLQNPAAHAAASFAASLSWPCPNIEACADSLSSSSSLPPSMAAVAAATVAAATAWWTAHGLLPLSPPPLHNSMIINPSTVSAAFNVADKRENELSMQDQQQKQSTPNSPTVSSSDSEKSEGTNQSAGVSASPDNEEATTATADPINTKRALTGAKTMVDRSSCGSNTPSGSEVETDALKTPALEKTEEELREEQPDDINHPGCEFNNGRTGSRSSYMTNDSWKEVSEEGRLAFQALFSREVLPQSFWPPNGMRNKGNQTKNLETDEQKSKNEKVEDGIELDLNSNMWGSCSPSHQLTELRSESNEKLLQWTMEIGQGNLKARSTGFKPYKRLKFS